MKRLVLVSGLVLLGSTGAIAATSCDAVTETPFANTVEYLWDSFELDLLASTAAIPSSQSCAVTASLEIPTGAVGYYRVDNRGFYFHPTGETTESTIDPDDFPTETETYSDEVDNFTHTAYYSSGPRASFEGDVGLELTGDVDSEAEAGLDTTDIAVFYTWEDELQASIDALAGGQSALVTHISSTAELLTGGNKPVDVQGSEVGILGGRGSYMFGVAGHYSIADGFSLLGGVSLIDQSAGGASGTGILGALAVRYVDPVQTSGFRLFGEGGLNFAALSTTFSRSYLTNLSVDPLTVDSTTSAAFGSAYVRGGVIVDVDSQNQVLLSTSVQQTGLGIAGYTEELTPLNPFPLTVEDQTAWFTVLRANAAWTTELSPELDLTANVGVGATIAHTPVNAEVAFVGDFAGTPQSTAFVDYGLRLGWMPTADLTVDVFAQGSTAMNGGTHAQIGSGLRMKF